VKKRRFSLGHFNCKDAERPYVNLTAARWDGAGKRCQGATNLGVVVFAHNEFRGHPVRSANLQRGEHTPAPTRGKHRTHNALAGGLIVRQLHAESKICDLRQTRLNSYVLFACQKRVRKEAKTRP
jgi:hypothetical protein